MKVKYNNVLNICPVCGYDDLSEPPYDKYNEPSYEICPCCGFEFGYDDFYKHYTFKDFREKWIKEGAKLFNKERFSRNWNESEMIKQLKNIELVKFYEPLLRD